MSATRALLMAAAVGLSCGASPVRGPDRGTRPPAPSKLASLLAAECSRCHGGGTERRLDGTTTLSPDRAMQAALLVSAERMPPRSEQMTSARRSELIVELCTVGAPDPERCAESLEPALDGPLARHPTEFLRALDLAGPPAPRPDGGASPATRLITGHANPDVLTLHLEPTWLTLTVLIAAERCFGFAEPARVDACLATALDPSLRSPAPPPPDESNLP